MAAAVLVLASVGVHPGRADAHPSPLDSLTIDLIVDQAGLVVIDGAANRDRYDPAAPSSEERATIAGQIVEALDIPADTAQVDGENSDLYHDVGFRISLHAPFANTDVPGAVRIDSAPLQQLAAPFGTLTLEVCRDARSDLTLIVDATTPAGAPDSYGAGAQGTDRADCRTWALHADDRAVVVTARVASGGASEPLARARVAMPCGTPSAGDPSFTEFGPIAHPTHILDAHATGGSSSHLLSADTVVQFSTLTRVDLVVPRRQLGHVSFGARDGPRATRQLSVPECMVDQASPWTVAVMRIWVDRAACVPVTVKTPHSKRTVSLPVGAPCPDVPTSKLVPTATLDCTNPIRVFGAGPCPGGTKWIAFPGGYSVTRPHCVTLVVRTEKHQERVRVGVGRTCPAQVPPPSTP